MEILRINDTNKSMVDTIYTHACDMFFSSTDMRPLRKCQSTVCEYDGNYILRSYNTIVAAYITYENGQKVFYDFLRYAYGYTATSAQHIAKFCKDYHVKQSEIVRFTY